MVYYIDRFSSDFAHCNFNVVFRSGDEALKGNCSVGQLTKIGFNQLLMNGYSLRQAYVESGFLQTTISPSEVYIRSDSMCIVINYY